MRFWRYHKEHARDGRIFDTDDVSPELLAEEGWVDNPNKFGHDPTGQADPAIVAKIQQDFEGGGGQDGLTFDQLQRKYEAERDAREKAQREADAKVAAAEQLTKDLQTKLDAETVRRQEAERVADEKADAVRGATSGKPAAKEPAAKKPATRTRKTAAAKK